MQSQIRSAHRGQRDLLLTRHERSITPVAAGANLVAPAGALEITSDDSPQARPRRGANGSKVRTRSGSKSRRLRVTTIRL